MYIAPIPIGHPDVDRIQPTWHCVIRFRERFFRTPGADEAVQELSRRLERARITTRPPQGINNNREPYALWAVSGQLAFPLIEGKDGLWTAPTCLKGA